MPLPIGGSRRRISLLVYHWFSRRMPKRAFVPEPASTSITTARVLLSLSTKPDHSDSVLSCPIRPASTPPRQRRDLTVPTLCPTSAWARSHRHKPFRMLHRMDHSSLH